MGRVALDPSEDFSARFNTLAHRGPDARALARGRVGRWFFEVGHHRLAILDPGGGAQPMRRGSRLIVFNGEIYNFRRLRESMPDARWTTESDTEVLLEFVARNGIDSLKECDGFFAFAMMDLNSGEILLARDRFGIKPLFLREIPRGGLEFSSEAQPFITNGGRADPGATAEYLFRDAVADNKTFIAGLRKLPPGAWLRWRDGNVAEGRFFELETLRAQTRRRVEPDQLWKRIETTVAAASVADRPVGVMLSGGLDSAVIASALRRQRGAEFPTFSLGFADERYDESTTAARVAQHLKLPHFVRSVNFDDLTDRWREVVTGLDEPLADPSLLPTRLLCEFAAERVPVVLGGDGGDEIFGGYPTYRAHRARPFLKLFPRGAWAAAAALSTRYLRTGDGYQSPAWIIKRLVERFDARRGPGHARWMSTVDWPDLARIAPAFPRPSPAPIGADPDDFLLSDLRHYLVDSVLTKVDRASMAVGLEWRPPFLSNELVDYAFAIPHAQKVSFGCGKIILRDAAAAVLPRAVIRGRKRGFALPLGPWLRGPLSKEIDRMISDGPLWPALDRTVVRAWRDALRDGRGDFARPLWSLLVLHTWAAARGISF